ncbi:MAG: transporter substrate-binding domain-containing protein [bacterium]|nr:transporter substrate-binding domain-containing protein [Candidatus Sumerlaeota bacterium]
MRNIYFKGSIGGHAKAPVSKILRGIHARIRLTARVTSLLIVVCAAAPPAPAMDAETSMPQRSLIIGTEKSPPFAMKNPDGTWSGISMILWKRICVRLGKTYEIKEYNSVQQLLGAVANGSVDAAISAISVNSEREQRVDFSQPYFASDLGIAMRASSLATYIRIFSAMFSRTILVLLVLMMSLPLLVGAIVWLCERRCNPIHFGGHPIKGIGSGFWWAAVTMTNVGYGDKVPSGFPGRFTAVVWMFLGSIIISMFTATITSLLTVSHFKEQFINIDDLRVMDRVGTVRGTIEEDYLTSRIELFQHPLLYESIEGAMSALDKRQIDAVIYDQPILVFEAKRFYGGRMKILPLPLSVQTYAIALPYGSPLRRPINAILLSEMSNPEWQGILSLYLGRDAFHQN